MSATMLAGLLLQTIWVVDASSGPGTNFTDLPPAVAAAQSGDVIRVRAGSYAGFVAIGKSLTIRGDGRAVTTIDCSTIAVVSSEVFVLAGLRIASSSAGANASALLLSGAGRVTLLDCGVEAGANAALQQAALMASGGVRVHASRSSVSGSVTLSIVDFVGGDGVRVVDSSFTATDSSIFGGFVSSGAPVPPIGGRALVVSNGIASLYDTHCYGGDAGSTTFIVGNGGAAILSDGFVRVGGAGSFVQGGASMIAYPALPALAIERTAGTAIVHTGVTLMPAEPGAAVLSAGVITGAAAQPRLDYTGTTKSSGELDATAVTTLSFDGLLPSAPFLFFLGLQPDHSTAFASLLSGELLVDLASGELVLGTLDAAGGFATTFTPSAVLAASLGMPIYSQAATFDFTLLQFRVSNVSAQIFSL